MEREFLLLVCIFLGLFLIPPADAQTSLAARHDYVRLIENTDQCLTDCYTIYEHCNPTDLSISTTSKSAWNLSFVEYKTDSLRAYGTEVLVNESYIEKIPITEATKAMFPNGTGYEVIKIIGYEDKTTYRYSWKDYSPLDKTWMPGECKKVRVWGKIRQGSSVDNIISFMGYTFSEYALWNSSWPYRKQLNINVTDGSTLTDFQVLINVTYDNNMQSGFADLRFTDNCTGEAVEIDHWIKNYTASQFANVLVEVPVINSTICMYYGNPAASTTSNAFNTFIVYDDFEDGDDSSNVTWETAYSSGSFNATVTTHGGNLVYNLTGSGTGVVDRIANHTGNATGDFDMELDFYIQTETSSGSGYPMYFGLEMNGQNFVKVNPTSVDDDINILSRVGGLSNGWKVITSDTQPELETGKWYRAKLSRRQTTNVTVYLADGKGNLSYIYQGSIDDEYNAFNGSILVAGNRGSVLYDNIKAYKFHDPAPTYTFGPEEWEGNYSYKNETYNTPVLENTVQEFSMTLQINSTTVSSVNASLVWNGTEYPYATYTEYGVYRMFTRSLTIPSISGSTEDVEFFWNFTVLYNTGYGSHEYDNTTYRNQTITKFQISDCSSDAHNVSVMWLFLVNEEGRTALNGSLEAVFETWAEPDGVTRFSFNFTLNQTAFRFCLHPGNVSVSANIDIKYESSNATNVSTFAKRNYYFRDITLSNVSINRTLYLLQNTFSTDIDFEVKDTSGRVLKDTIIHIERYFLGGDEYMLVAMGKTGFDGKITVPLRMNEWYKYTLLDNATVLTTIAPSQLADTSLVLYTDFEDRITFFEYFEDVAYNCSFNNATKNIVCTIVDTSGHLQASFLMAKRIDPAGGFTICSDSSTSPTTTLICNIAGYTSNGTVVYTLYGIFGSEESAFLMVQDGLTFGIIAVYGVIGIFVVFLMVLGSALMGIWNPAVMIILVCVSLIFSFAIGFLPVGYMSLVGIIIVGGLIVFKLK